MPSTDTEAARSRRAETEKNPMQEHDATPWWRTRSGLVFLGFSLIAAYFLITEHSAHLALAVPYLPWLFLAACPLMHLFMRHGHGGHGGSEQNSGGDAGPHRADRGEGDNRS